MSNCPHWIHFGDDGEGLGEKIMRDYEAGNHAAARGYGASWRELAEEG